MGFSIIAIIVAAVLVIFGIGIILKSAKKSAPAWECVTCGASNAAGASLCSQCGMERQA